MGITITFVGSDSRLINSFSPSGSSDGPLKRAQAAVGLMEEGVEIARTLLAQKFAAQLSAATIGLPSIGVHPSSSRLRWVVDGIRSATQSLPFETELRGLLVREGYVARLYWSLLTGVTLGWPGWAARRVPNHWLTISSRELGATQQVRDATDPFNAVLNYAYTLLEVETRVAIVANGLEPDLGLLHVDARARESLVYDLVEPNRSLVDVLCLGYVQNTIRPHMFIELRNGVVRLDPDFARELGDLDPAATTQASCGRRNGILCPITWHRPILSALHPRSTRSAGNC
jgi:CRISPR-associated endonuclease Cas1